MFSVRFRSRWLVRGLFVASCALPGAGCADTAAERASLVPPIIRLGDEQTGLRAPVQSIVLEGAAAAKREPVQTTEPPLLNLVFPPAHENESPSAAVPPTVHKDEPPAAPELLLPPSANGVAPIVQAAHKDGPAVALAPELLPPKSDPVPKPALPAPGPLAIAPRSAPAPSVEEKLVPINLDTVLRLAEEQNGQIALARERLHESEAEQSLAAKSWLPRVLAGTGYYRHEGGIQNEDGSLTHSSMQSLYPGLDIQAQVDLREATYRRVDAERKAWQQRGELSKVTSETLLEAATTYVDLLTARRGEQVAIELEKYLLNVQERTEKLVTGTDRSAQPLVEAVRGEVDARRQSMAKLRQQGNAAAAKLAYLLGLGPTVRLVPVQEELTPIDLVDPTPPLADLVARAVATGPGVRETMALLGALQGGVDTINGPMRLLPVMSLNVNEGYFGAGPGSHMSFDNRLDTCLQVRWNLTEWVTAREKRRVAESHVEQARLTVDDLRGKLTASVREAREASLSGREQIAYGRDAMDHAIKSYKLSDKRLTDRVPGATAIEVLTAIRGLELAHFNYLSAINAYNKAQIRLLVLSGPAECARK